MALITKTRLNEMAQIQAGTRFFSQAINEARINLSKITTNTFLSHSHDDLESGDLNKALYILFKAGIKVYIDSKDSKMPPFTNALTAHNIKDAIKKNQKFILLASNKSISSRWCNWELGFGDSQKYINNIALFPLAENSGAWEGSEYLNIYPRIEDINGYLRVIYPDKTSRTITEWLAIK